MEPSQASLFPETNLLPDHGEVFYFPSFFSEAQSDAYFRQLREEVLWKQEPVRLFGKEIMQPRLTAWFGDKGYSYSGLTMQPQPFSTALAEIRQAAEACAGVAFNSCLLNLYRDGNDSMGWHRDNEKNLGKFPVIASVSFGEARRFQLRDYAGKKRVKSLELGHGSLLIMRGETQRYWEHRVPKTNKSTEPRINITFRVVS